MFWNTYSESITLLLIVLLFSASCTEIVRHFAHRLGFISRPAKGRWSQRTVALGGGISINLALILGILWLGKSLYAAVLAPLLIVFIVGLIDDFRGVTPSMKLMAQATAAAIAISQGYMLSTPWPVLSIGISVLWYVGLSNAVNLSDNMDGLAAGMSAIAGLGFCYLFFTHDQPTSAALAIVFVASVGGFLIHNFPPAKIFMGDAGSLSLGFILAILSTQLRVTGDSVHSFWSILPACLVLVVPLFDTTLVMISRRHAKRPIMIGGRDHTSHRIFALGFSERKTIGFLYLFGLVGVFLATILVDADGFMFTTLSIIGLGLLCLLVIFFLEIFVYPSPSNQINWDSKRSRLAGQHSLPLPILYMMELTIDVGIICFAWIVAHQMRFYEAKTIAGYDVSTIIPMLPYLIAVKLGAFSFFKLYRGMWRTISLKDVYRIFKATTAGTLLLIAGAALVTRLEDLSRIVLVLDWMLTFFGVLGARTALSGFRRWSRKFSDNECRAALFGPPSLYHLVRDALKDENGIKCIGCITSEKCSDPTLFILGAEDELQEIVAENKIDVLIVGQNSSHETLNFLAGNGVLLRELKIQLS